MILDVGGSSPLARPSFLKYSTYIEPAIRLHISEVSPMTLTFYYGSGSPYAWRVWLALEHKNIPYTLKTLSFDAKDLEAPEVTVLNPRQKVPIIVDDGFALYESAAIVEYLEDRWPGKSPLFSSDVRHRAIQRRMIGEIDQYFAPLMERFANLLWSTPQERWSEDQITATYEEIRKELVIWDNALTANYIAGELSAVDFTLYPEIALVIRVAARKQDIQINNLLGQKLQDWMMRMKSLPYMQKTWPPHWR